MTAVQPSTRQPAPDPGGPQYRCRWAGMGVDESPSSHELASPEGVTIGIAQPAFPPTSTQLAATTNRPAVGCPGRRGECPHGALIEWPPPRSVQRSPTSSVGRDDCHHPESACPVRQKWRAHRARPGKGIRCAARPVPIQSLSRLACPTRAVDGPRADGHGNRTDPRAPSAPAVAAARVCVERRF